MDFSLIRPKPYSVPMLSFLYDTAHWWDRGFALLILEWNVESLLFMCGIISAV